MSDASNIKASENARHWLFDEGEIFLNHGSFGACPQAVLDEQTRWRQEMERQPLDFLDRRYHGLLAEARSVLAEFVGADQDDMGFVPNATGGVNAVLRSLDFKPGDELLMSDHEYNACKNALYYIAKRTGAKAVVVNLPFPLESEEEIIECLLEAVSDKTRLLMIDHVTSPTALVLPVKRIVEEFDRRGIDTLVDGAHAPGMLPLDINDIGAAYYTGNCHKWLCTPKGSAFLHVRRDRRKLIKPLSISHGYLAEVPEDMRFRLEFDWTGTTDPSAVLAIPKAIEFLGSLYPGGIKEHMRKNRQLAIEARGILCDKLSIDTPCPESMLGAMASLPLCDNPHPPDPVEPWKDRLQAALYSRYRIEAIVTAWPQYPKRLLRVCAQAYNSLEQYEYTALRVAELLEEERSRPI